MRILGNLNQYGSLSAPVIVIGVFDAATSLPSYAIVQEDANEVAISKINGTTVCTVGLIDDFSLQATRPQQGGGILRQTISLSIISEHAKGYPFFKVPLSKAFYYAGQSIDSYYFGVWAIDRRDQFLDVTQGCFLGFFKVDASVKWQESNGVTTIGLIDVLLQDQNKVGATDETIPDQLFLFNAWYNAPIVPKVFGQVPRVKMLNLFPSIAIRKLSNSITGRIESNYTNASATIDLEKNADQASVLRQLIAIGGNVRIKMHDGEVILGSLAYNSGTGIVTLTVVTRNTYYGQANGYTFPGNGQTPADWGTFGIAQDQNKWPGQWCNSASVLINGTQLVQDPNGYMRASINFYDAASGTKELTYTVATKLNGWDTEKKDVITHDPWVHTSSVVKGSLSTCGLSTEFNASITPDPLISYGWAPGAYVYFANVPKTVDLWFNNPDTAVAGSGSIGDNWQLVAIEPSSIDYSCVIRNGFSHFTNDHVYCEGDGRLIKIPTANVSSVSDSGTVLGLANMAKIALTMAPLDMGIGATSNVVYTDALYKTASKENRTERIIYEILKESPSLVALAGKTITDYANYIATAWTPYCGVLVRDVKTVVEVIDRLLFQVNCTFQWQAALFELRGSAYTFSAETLVTISGQDYTYPNTAHTDDTEMIEDTAGISCGQVLTAVDANGYEYIPLYFDIQYGGWEDPYYKPVKPSVNRGMKKNQRLFSYKFDYINDANSANFAVGAALSIGHQSGLACIERTIETDMLMDGLRWEPCDPITFRDFPLLSTSDETNANLDAFGHPRYLRPTDGKKFLMGAVAQIERVTLKCVAGANPVVSIEAKMSQTFVEASGTGVYAPPYPPSDPPTPPTDPNQPPNGSGGSQQENIAGGYYSPMMPGYTNPDDVTIDSLSDEVTSMTLNVIHNFIWNEGWAWRVACVPVDGVPLVAGAVSISPATGSFPDKVSDTSPTYATPTTININVNYLAVPGGATSRQFKLVFTRTIALNRLSSLSYADTFEVSFFAFVTGPTDIVAS